MDKTEAGRLIASLRQPRVLMCSVCGREFTGVGRAQYCSESCKSHAYYARKNPGARRRQVKGEGEGR